MALPPVGSVRGTRDGSPLKEGSRSLSWQDWLCGGKSPTLPVLRVLVYGKLSIKGISHPM
jgi:hypothetical protein